VNGNAYLNNNAGVGPHQYSVYLFDVREKIQVKVAQLQFFSNIIAISVFFFGKSCENLTYIYQKKSDIVQTCVVDPYPDRDGSEIFCWPGEGGGTDRQQGPDDSDPGPRPNSTFFI
jgi:hypothetical protein